MASVLKPRQSHRQKRIVQPRRAGADEYRIIERTLHMHKGIGCRGGDREPRRAGRPSGKAVRRLRQFERQHRPALRHPQDMAAIRRAASFASTPLRTSMPAAASRAWPRPPTRGSGSSTAETTRAMPAAITASAQGGVRP